MTEFRKFRCAVEVGGMKRVVRIEGIDAGDL